MRLKFDENITVLAAGLLVALGHDVDTVADEKLSGHPDPGVFAAAQADGRALVTFDLGFGDIRAYPPGSHHGIFLLRLRDQGPDNVMATLGQLARNNDLDALARCLTVLTDTAIRIRWPD